MRRRAKLQINQNAVRKADNDFYLKHPGMVRHRKRIPLDPANAAQWRLRQEWFDLYVKYEGQVEGGDLSPIDPDEPVSQCPVKEPALVEITVRVIDDSDGAPIEAASVSIDTLGAKPTDGDGYAKFECVKPGVYSISATASNYIPVPGYEKVEIDANAPNTGIVRLQVILEGIYSTEKSVKYSSGAGPDDKIVYLTFDDGPWAGTPEVFNLLKKAGVPGTFFMVGEHATASMAAFPNLFQEIYDHPMMQVCNHSCTHTHEHYGEFYESGLKLNPVTLEPDSVAAAPVRRSVLMDFEYASLAFTEVLSQRKIRRPDDPRFDARGKLDFTKLRAYSRFLTARFPGTNLWRFGAIHYEWGKNVAKKTDEADDLVINDYKIIGWDLEWKAFPGDSSDFVPLLKKEYDVHGDGYLDLYDPAVMDFDRPPKSGEQTFEETKSMFDAWVYPKPRTPNKIVLLMHERCFRRYKPGSEDKFINELADYIDRCTKAGFKFDVVANY